MVFLRKSQLYDTLRIMPSPVTEALAEARRTRRELGYGPWQRIDPAIVARDLAILVVRRPLRSGTLDGIHLYDPELDQHFVLVNSAHRSLRQRFTLAHEIGHARFDKETIVESMNTGQSSPHEQRANAFAGELLMPEAALREWVPGTAWGDDVDEIARLALHFGLSFQATLWRLHNARLIGDVRAIEARRGEVSETHRSALAAPGDRATEYPVVFTELVRTGVREGLVSRGRAAELLSDEDEI